MSIADVITALQTALADAQTGVPAIPVVVSDLQTALTDAQSLQPSVPVIVSTQFDMNVTITDTFQYSGGRYERFKQLLVIGTSPFSLPLQASGWAGGGTTNVTFGYARIDVGIASVATDGTLGTSNIRGNLSAPTARVGNATLTLVDEPDGPCLITLYGVDAGGTSTKLISHGAYIDRTGNAKNHPYCWVQNCSNDWEAVNNAGGNTPTDQRALVKVADIQTTRVQPLSPRIGAVSPTAMLPVNITRRELVPGGINYGVRSRPNRTKSGIWHTENRQDYFYTDLVSKAPKLPLLDGPRGACTTPMTTDIVFGRNGKVYGANPWQVWVIDSTGTKRTLYGIRHLYPITWSEACSPGDPGWDSMMEIVGNWDASVPLAERFAWESWGMSWDQRTLFPIDDSAPIPPGETEHPHYPPGPTHFRTDRHGYVLRAQSSPISHTIPPTITRWCSANDPWGIACVGNLLYVSERGANRISIFSADTPNTYLGALIEDTTAVTLGAVDQSLRRWKGANAATCRSHTIVAPEGLVYQDGYVYWGSLAQAEVRRIAVSGGTPEVVAQPYVDNNSNYVYIAISDGNFGPRGSVAATTWSVTNSGRPHIYLPTAGVAPDGTPLTNSVEWQWDGEANGIIQGRGPHWNTDSYGSAVAFGYAGANPPRPEDPAYGALACSSANGNISIYTLADDAVDGPARSSTDQRTFDAQMLAGLVWYRANAQVLHDVWCSGANYQLPWGQNADADAFMHNCGYAP